MKKNGLGLGSWFLSKCPTRNPVKYQVGLILIGLDQVNPEKNHPKPSPMTHQGPKLLFLFMSTSIIALSRPAFFFRSFVSWGGYIYIYFLESESWRDKNISRSCSSSIAIWGRSTCPTVPIPWWQHHLFPFCCLFYWTADFKCCYRPVD